MTDRERTEADRQFAARLSDWSDPGALVLVRRGQEVIPEETAVEPITGAVLAVDRIDEDGNIILEDGSIIID